MSRTAKQIVNQTNEMARHFYKCLGYEGAKGFRFDRSRHPTEYAMWKMACIAQEMLTDTDPENSLSDMEDE